MSTTRDASPATLLWRFLLDAAASLSERPARTVLTMMGIVLGLASITATSGLALAAQTNVARTFDQFAATTVSLRAADTRAVATNDRLTALARLPGVTGVGSSCVVRDAGTARLPERGGTARQVSIVGIVPGTLDTFIPTFAAGSDSTSLTGAGALPTAVIGIGAWRSLGGGPSSLGGVVDIGGHRFSVGGVVDGVRRHPTALGEIYVSHEVAARLWGAGCATREVLVATAPGATQGIGAVAAATLDPVMAHAWSVTVPPSPDALAASVQQDLTGLYLALAGMSLLIGALSIGNTMSMTVMERTAEIGTRRAIGYTRGAILLLLSMEAAMLGLLGGLLGAALGVGVVAGVTWWRDWPFLVDPILLLLASPAGALIGLVGGLVPAIRAGRLSPASAVRQ